MKVAFRTLKGEKFELDAEPEETVLDLKKRVVKKQNEDDYSGYRLIYKGKILDNAKTLVDSGVSGTGFIVVMPPKKAQSKPEAKKPAASSSEKPAASASKPTAAATSASSAAAPAAATESTAAAPAPASAPPAPAATLVTGAQYDATVRQICEMGFPEAEVKRALRAAFNNPERAVDYLFSGIPAGVDAPAPAVPAGGAAAAPSPAAGTAPAAAAPRATPPVTPGMPFNMFDQNAAAGGESRGGQPGNLDFLRHLPPFNNMRRVIQANPNVIHQLLRQLEQTDPALLQLINANRAEFLRLINEPVDDGAEAGDEVIQQLAQAMAGAGAGGDGAAQGPGPRQIVVTEEENQVINRLTELGSAMGLQQVHCVEAWLACDRDENLAANFLLNQAEDIRAAQAEDASLAAQARGNEPDNDPSGDGGNNASDNPPDAGN